VIQHVSGTIPTSSSGSVQLSSYTNSKLKWSFYGPFFPRYGISGFSSQVFTTFGPGEVPLVDIYATSHANIICEIVVSGYLIDAENQRYFQRLPRLRVILRDHGELIARGERPRQKIHAQYDKNR
jgi:hypothetical protein